MSRSRQMDGIVGVDNTALMPCMYGTAFDRRRTKIIKVLENRVSDEIGEDFRIRTAIYDVPDYVNLSEQRLLIISGGPGDFIGEIAERHIYLLCLVKYKDVDMSDTSTVSRNGNGFIYIIDSQPKPIKYQSNVPKLLRDIAKYLNYREIVTLKGAQEGIDCFSKCLSFVALALGGAKLEDYLPSIGNSFLIKITKNK